MVWVPKYTLQILIIDQCETTLHPFRELEFRVIFKFTKSMFINAILCQAARREMERQRQLEWEKQRRQELLSQRQKEQEKVLQLKAQNQNLGIELEQLVWEAVLFSWFYFRFSLF